MSDVEQSTARMHRVGQKHEVSYINFKPLNNSDTCICQHTNCGQSLDKHSGLQACPYLDGSGYRLNQYFKHVSKILEVESFAELLDF